MPSALMYALTHLINDPLSVAGITRRRVRGLDELVALAGEKEQPDMEGLWRPARRIYCCHDHELTDAVANHNLGN